MTKKLFFQAIVKFILGFILSTLLIFLPAGSIYFWNGWLLIALIFIPMFIAGIVMMTRNTDLLQKRLNSKEKESEQKVVILLSGIMFISAFVLAGLNFRFAWMILPNLVVYVATGVFILSLLIYFEVLRENVYLSRTVEIQKNQKVIDTGLYAIVRHPMYFSTLFLYISMGFVLGSPISVAILLLYIPIIAKRIKNEEMILTDGLEGYEEYRNKVKYKVIPFIW